MKTLAFIAHPYHRLTQSTQIFDFLSDHFKIERFYDNRYGTGNIDENRIRQCDVNFYFQTAPLFLHKNLIWAPMYDDNFRTQIPGVKYICFCKQLYSELGNVSKLLVQYWKKPATFNQSNRKTILFWNRTNQIQWNQVRNFFLNEKIDKTYFKDSPDPGHPKATINPDDMKRFNIQMTGFD